MVHASKKQCANRREIQMISIEDLVPQIHVLHDIDRVMNFDIIYDAVEDLYISDKSIPCGDKL